jgi:hypothetical protein
MREFPFAIDDSERNIFIWRTSTEVQKHGFVVPRLLDNLVCRRLGFVDKVRIKDIKLQGDMISMVST